jgi:hypothetical protein
MKYYVTAFLVIVLLGFVKWYSDRQYDAGVAVTESKYEKKLRAQEQKTEEARIHGQKAVNSITELWLNKPPIVKVQHEEIIKYVKDDNYCNATRGAVSLLNRSTGLELSQYPTLTDEEASATSTVTQRDIIGLCTERGEQYQVVSGQLVALQETVRELDCVVF